MEHVPGRIERAACGCVWELGGFSMCRWHEAFLAFFYPSLPARTRITASLAKAEARIRELEAERLVR